MTRKNHSTSNEGIQANVVKADVLAVGRGAQAVKMVLRESDREDILTAVGEIRRELGALKLEKAYEEEVQRHAQELERAATKKNASPAEVKGALGGLLEKLKQAGVIVSEVAGLVSPIQTIAGLLHLTLSSFGLM